MRVSRERVARVALGLALLACLGFAIGRACFLSERATITNVKPVGAFAFEGEVAGLFPWGSDGLVLEEGRALGPHASPEAVVTQGAGRFWIEGRTVLWSSLDGSSPLQNGRRYEILARAEPLASPFFSGLLAVTAGLVVLNAWLGTIALTGVSPRRTRVGLALAVAVVLGTGTARRFGFLFVGVDTASYLNGNPTRTSGYPAFVNLLDRSPREPRVDELAWDDTREDPDHRYVNVARGQKVLTALAVTVLAWSLSGSLNAWLVGALALLGILRDRRIWGDAAIAWNSDAITSEGLNHPLVFLLLALLAALWRRPTRKRWAALGLLLALLQLVRPSNAALLFVLGPLFFRERARSGTRAAVVGLGWAVVWLAVPLLLECERRRERDGYFRLHAFAGPNVIGMALQVATPEDVAAFDDPLERELVRVCLVDLADKRLPFCANGDHVNRNLYGIALPALDRLPGFPTARRAYVADDLFRSVGRKLIARHPGATVRLVLEHGRAALDGPLHLVYGASVLFGIVAWRKSRAEALGLFLLLAAIPCVAIVPGCVLNFPYLRYRAPFFWLEVLLGPLLGVTLLTLARSRGTAPLAGSAGAPAASG